MANIKKFRVVPYLPEKLKPLLKIANNLWWVWNFEAIELFRRIDVDLWRESHHNPIKVLGMASQKTLDEAAESESFLAHMERVATALDWHLSRKTWFEENKPGNNEVGIAYFSAEFGIHECLPIYSGGLGVLSGDHLKSASELGLPLYGVGLLYRLGYFHQYLTFDGWQQERFPENDYHNLPVRHVEREGKPLVISVEFPGRNVHAQVWEVEVGRVHLFLLDTNIDLNNTEDRSITDQLYGGDSEMRVKQEIMLGIGGVRALLAMNKKVTVFHMNEGHAAFLGIERIANAMEQGLSFNEALEFVTTSNVFTTHTPVPAGNDRFEPELIDIYFMPWYGKFNITRERFMALGRENPQDKKETFCMTVLALKTAAYANGVSKLHGQVSRNMWRGLWPSLPSHEVPVGHITNGVQTLSWTSDEMMRLLNRYLGPGWIDNPTDMGIWQNIEDIPDSELWRCRERLRERLVGFCRKTLREQLLERGVPMKEAEKANSVLDPDALTIGFARRFATYKRATLILRDINRLIELLRDRERPVQLIFSGKAHPRDTMGKEFIKQIVHLTEDDRFRNQLVFLEDYDINTARYLVQGVDVWLNNPIRPKEASGTSGMKVVPNGGLNISVLDGWWDEAYNGENGWAIGKGEEYEDQNYQDEVESLSLYKILKEDVIPTFYNRGLDGLPREWIGKIRSSMKSNCPVFSTNRMVKDYTEKYYVKAHENFLHFYANNFAVSRELAHWKGDVMRKWDGVQIREVQSEQAKVVEVGSKINVRAEIHLGELSEDDVRVELYFGGLTHGNDIENGVALPMYVDSRKDDGTMVYRGQILCLRSGQFAFTVRVVPYQHDLVRKFDPSLRISWA